MITKQFIVAAHSKLIILFGGTDGIRDERLLESAIARPLNVKAYKNTTDIFDISASIAYGLIQNHPFIDGNKRIGALMCELTLVKAGYEMTASEEEKYLIYMKIAASELSEADLVKWLKENTKSKK